MITNNSIVRLASIWILVIVVLTDCERIDFTRDHERMHGTWIVRGVSGGISGGGYKANFDVMTINQKMHYFLYRNDTLISNGRINIIEETNEELKVEFNTWNSTHPLSLGYKYVDIGRDTMFINDGCCDGYSYFFVRSEIYSNLNFIQPKKTLDFLEVNNYPIGFNKFFTSVFFVNENLGFISSYDGSILKTTTGGINWKETETNNTLPLYKISFINENIGFAVGGKSGCEGSGCIAPGYLMLKTTDAGETWEKVSLPYKQAEFNEIKFFNSNFGIAFGKGVKLKTIDGGLNWDSFSYEDMTGVFRLFLLNNEIAYLSGIKGQLFKTNDSGATWKDIGFNTNFYITSVTFLNEQIGYIGFWNSLMKTTDGGITWNKMEYAPLGVSTMHFNSEKSAVVFGARSYASSKLDVWDSYINILINGKWFGDERVSSHMTPFCLNPKTYIAVTYDNKISIIKITN